MPLPLPAPLSPEGDVAGVAVQAYRVALERASARGGALPSPDDFLEIVRGLAARADVRARWPALTPEIRDLVERYVGREGELGPHTRRAYRRAITRAIEELEGELMTAGRFGEYVTARMKAGASRATMQLEAAAVRGWFRWLLDEGVISRNPLGNVRVKLAGGDKKPAPALSLQEVQGILAAPLLPDAEVVRRLGRPAKRRTWTGIPRPQRLRDRALMCVGFYLGLRRSEITSLTVGSLRLGGPRGVTLTYRAAKGQRKVLVRPLRHDVQDALLEYLALRARGKVGARPGWDELLRGLGQKEPLFRARAIEMRGISAGELDAIVQRWALVAGVPRHPPEGARARLSAHSMRGTYITLAHSAGADLPRIQASVGHVSYATTAAYIQISGELDRDPSLMIG